MSGVFSYNKTNFRDGVIFHSSDTQKEYFGEGGDTVERLGYNFFVEGGDTVERPLN